MSLATARFFLLFTLILVGPCYILRLPSSTDAAIWPMSVLIIRTIEGFSHFGNRAVILCIHVVGHGLIYFLLSGFISGYLLVLVKPKSIRTVVIICLSFAVLLASLFPLYSEYNTRFWALNIIDFFK